MIRRLHPVWKTFRNNVSHRLQFLTDEPCTVPAPYFGWDQPTSRCPDLSLWKKTSVATFGEDPSRLGGRAAKSYSPQTNVWFEVYSKSILSKFEWMCNTAREIEAATQPLVQPLLPERQSGWVSAPATLAERLSGWVAERLSGCTKPLWQNVSVDE